MQSPTSHDSTFRLVLYTSFPSISITTALVQDLTTSAIRVIFLKHNSTEAQNSTPNSGVTPLYFLFCDSLNLIQHRPAIQNNPLCFVVLLTHLFPSTECQFLKRRVNVPFSSVSTCIGHSRHPVTLLGLLENGVDPILTALLCPCYS